MREEFHRHETPMARLPSLVYSLDNYTLRLGLTPTNQ
jgi:hypothetical protein